MDRLVYQYRYSERLKALIESLLSESGDLRDQLQRLPDRLNIETQVGVQLDGIGEYLGAPRPRVAAGEDEAFAFSGPATGLGFNEGQFVGLFTDFDDAEALSDSDYRAVLRAARNANRSNCNLFDLEQFFAEAVGLPVVLGVEHRRIEAVVPRPLFQFEQRIVELLAPVRAGTELVITVDSELSGYLDATDGLYTTVNFTIPGLIG